jgi:hypothetical protein
MEQAASIDGAAPDPLSMGLKECINPASGTTDRHSDPTRWEGDYKLQEEGAL